MEPNSMNEARVRRPSSGWGPTKTVAILSLAGLLIWAKLRLVTDFPRVVQAEPEVTEPQADETAGTDSPPTHSGQAPSRPDPAE